VHRTALVDRLDAARERLVSVVAPPGYGKTTVLAQLAERKGRRVAWVSVDRHDNDPMVLLTYLAVALDRVEPIDPDVLQTLAVPGGGVAATIVPRLVAAVSSMTGPIWLVLDNLELLENPQCLDAVGELAVRLPKGSQLALASRARSPLSEALLHPKGRMIEVGVAELMMDQEEAQGLLEGAEVRLHDAEVGDLVGRTEGWPVGLYLAALAVKAGGPQHTAGSAFNGDDRYLVDYLRLELLARLPAEQVTFLTRTAVLDRMCGPLCDAILGTAGAGQLLESLAGSNLLLIALDRHQGWYRYHHLFRELLRADLERHEPELVAALHARAATWCDANGLPETAIDHALDADDADLVARVVLGAMQPVWASGRVDTVLRWMEWFEEKNLVERYPAVAVHGALIFALVGRPIKAERWAAAAERAPAPGKLLDGSTMASYLAYLRALLCRDGVGEMRRDAQMSWHGLSPESPYRASMRYTEGVSYLLEGDPDPAELILGDALAAATDAGASPLAAVILAELCLIAVGRDDWSQAEALAERALSILEGGDFDDYWTSALVYALAARTSWHRGDISEAHERLTRAARLRPLLTYALPVVSVQALLELTRCYVAVGEPEGARAVLGQAQEILQQRPDLGVLPKQAEELRSEVEQIVRKAVSGSSLTTAEMRILPLLSTHLTFREIGERLYLSPNTVKSQAMSVYRKLGVSSRSEAIERAHEIGLLVV
jgi:LuxR family transcriptional regulator, maltose regulon positive regulatory protein